MKPVLLAAALLGAVASQAGPPDWVAATVVKVDVERSRVTLDHAAIKKLDMAAMVMPFKVEPAVDLKRFKPGDRVRFIVVQQGDHPVVRALEKAK